MTQNEILLNYLQEHEEGITAREALLELGIGRLASRICDLKREKYPISSTSEKVTTRYGSTYVARYRLIKSDSKTCANCVHSSYDENTNGIIYCNHWASCFENNEICAMYEKGDREA